MGAQAGRRRGPKLPAFRASPVKGLLCGEGWRAAEDDATWDGPRLREGQERIQGPERFPVRG